MTRGVERGLNRRDHERHLPHLSLDEKSFQKGRHYITALGDSLGKGVLDVVEGRTLEVTKLLLESSLSLSQKEQQGLPLWSILWSRASGSGCARRRS